MADEFNTGTNWWDSSAGNRFDSAGPSSASSGHNGLGCSFAWPIEMAEVKASSSLESVSVSDSSSVFHDTQKLQHGHDSAGDSHIMNLGLSSQAMDWNHALLRGDKAENSFPSMLHENLNSGTDYHQETGMGSSQIPWSERVITGVSVDSTMNEFKQSGRGFSLDQPQFSSHGSSSDSPVTCQGLQPSFQMDSSVTYGNPSTMFLGLLGSENQPQQSSFESRRMSYPYRAANYGVGGNESSPSSWSKMPQILRNSPPKQAPHSQLHFSNNAPFWNASASAVNDVRPSFFPMPQPQFPAPKFEQKPKQNMSKVPVSSTAGNKSSGSDAAAKRPRNEAPSPLPPFKARKEKIGDRITALQQLVSPFGKTDTASVLSEAIEYIKVLHEQVTVLSTPYMKSRLPTYHQQGTDKSKDPEEQKQDLRSRGLCLVPVSSTLPVAPETTMDFWPPTFGGTFR